MTSADIAIAILSWKAPAYIKALLRNLRAVPPCGQAGLSIRVLDQESGSGTGRVLDEAAAADPRLSVRKRADNLGFAGGIHALLEGDLPPLVLLLNQDVLFDRPGWLDRLVAAFDDPLVAAAGPHAMLIDCRRRAFLLPPRDADPAAFGLPWFIEGSVLLLRSQAIRDLGLFDETFAPAYGEDADLGARLLACGRRLARVPIRHVHGWQGDAARKAAQAPLAEAYPDFKWRNEQILFDRWASAGAIKPAELRTRFPRLWFPG